jgi:hypothetical protein
MVKGRFCPVVMGYNREPTAPTVLGSVGGRIGLPPEKTCHA